LTDQRQFDNYHTMVELQPGQFERIAKALSDPRRFSVLEVISGGQECPQAKLCQDFPVTKATISHHLKELVSAGLIEPEKDGQFMHYSARRDVLAAYSTELMCRLGLSSKV
jgi:ArsR family transcriptional regulator, arsenate/arsenite/antimonite-responsive transcriptional repressor